MVLRSPPRTCTMTTVSLTDQEIQKFWDQLSASRWNSSSDMPITDDDGVEVPSKDLHDDK